MAYTAFSRIGFNWFDAMNEVEFAYCRVVSSYLLRGQCLLCISIKNFPVIGLGLHHPPFGMAIIDKTKHSFNN